MIEGWETATPDQCQVYRNQTDVLFWLRRIGHEVDFTRDRTVPSPDLAPIKLYVGKPCPYCNVKMGRHGPEKATRDHKVARCKGGKLTVDNRVICCRRCNNEKGAKTLYEWFQLLASQSDRRARRIGILLGLLSPE